jgi:SCP1.201-like deaminase
MASVADVIAGLKAVLTQVGTARRLLAGVGWDKAAETYRATMTGSTAPEATELAQLDNLAQRQLAEADQLAARTETSIAAIITRLGGTASEPATARHRDDSRYPAAAAWAVPDLPRRVREGDPNERTIGRMLVGGRDLHTMTSGRDGTWTPEIRSRLAKLGIRTTLRLENHVEMKVAQMMIQLGERDGQVVINHAPCGPCEAVATRFWRGTFRRATR